MSASYGSSVWNQGAEAAREGLPASACPFGPVSYDFVVWFNGWAWAKHQIAREEELEEL